MGPTNDSEPLAKSPDQLADEALLAILALVASGDHGVLTARGLDEATELVRRARFDDALVQELREANGSGFTYINGRATRRSQIALMWALVESHGIEVLREEARRRRDGSPFAG